MEGKRAVLSNPFYRSPNSFVTPLSLRENQQRAKTRLAFKLALCTAWRRLENET